MTWRVSDLQEQVMAVRRHYTGKDARPGERLSGLISPEGQVLLTMVDSLPKDGVVVTAALLSAIDKVRAVMREPGPNLCVLTEEEQKSWDGA